MCKFIVIALVALSTPAQARDTKTKDILTHYQSRPILALTEADQKLGNMKQVEAYKNRASMICEFLRQPAGNFRSRHAEGVLTEGFKHDGKLAQLEKLSDGSIRASLVKIDKTEHPEVFKSLRCVGVN